MKKENRVAKVLNSLEDLQKPKVPENGFQMIQQKLADQRKGKSMKPHQRTDWMKVAAVIALVICSNVWAIKQHLTSEQDARPDADGYTQITTDFNLYDYE